QAEDGIREYKVTGVQTCALPIFLSDLRLGESKNHLPVVAVRVIPVGPQSADTSGQDEFDMDTQSSTAMATTVNGLYLYNVGSLKIGRASCRERVYSAGVGCAA